ncbi:N-arachidonyl glycine receptor [Pseudoliparis swirei]|uniref:N-arachidonyl glycine receptor n=1 Tax=Pseudoliparis swirei TaxID=2059687 RepID=UPI0024BDC892|nr:N-arachidonyl glycine receptor [Pseudoliparis swirei]XP_056286360.1 N-arachidonyl glycine receptor [Pseudoliparis swirei]
MTLNLNFSKMSGAAVRPEPHPAEYRVAGLVFYSFVFAVGLVVNVTALWVFSLTTKKKNSVTVYMINVALVDLTFLLLLPFRMVYLHRDSWPFGDLLCRVVSALTVFYPCMALWLFALISADRYMAVVQPKHGRELRNVPKAVVASLAVWVMTLGGTASLLFSEGDPDRASDFTTCVKMRDVVHVRRDNPVDLARLVFFFLVPVCIMIGCYVVIVDNLLRGRTSRLKPEVKQKSIRIILTLIVQVLVCFVPFHVCLVLRSVGSGTDFSVWAVFSTFLMTLSTVLDVILFYIVSKQFQDRVISVILYRNYLRSVRRKSRRTGTGSVRSLSNLTGVMI